jgi:AraC family transcriptional regulator
MTGKIFIRPQFKIILREVARAQFAIEAHADYVLLLILRGSLQVTGPLEQTKAQRGSVLLINQGESLNFKSNDATVLILNLSSVYVLDCAVRTRLVSKEAAKISFRPSTIERNEKLSRLAQDLIEELNQEEAGQEIIISALVEQLTVYLLRHHANARISNELELSRVGLVDRRIRRAVEFMHAQLDRELSIEEIAAAAYLSPFHFSRLFKKLTGATPHAYLANLRIARAQTLLAETDLSITQIAARVGYASSSHFTKAFRQATGLTPREFRNALVKR